MGMGRGRGVRGRAMSFPFAATAEWRVLAPGRTIFVPVRSPELLTHPMEHHAPWHPINSSHSKGCKGLGLQNVPCHGLCCVFKDWSYCVELNMGSTHSPTPQSHVRRAFYTLYGSHSLQQSGHIHTTNWRGSMFQKQVRPELGVGLTCHSAPPGPRSWTRVPLVPV